MNKKTHKYKRFLITSATILSVIPSLALAIPDTFKLVIDSTLDTIWILIPILFALAFVIFFWGLSKFILNSGNPADIKKGRDYMLWGVLALFILVSIRAIISFVQTDLELEHNVSPFLPTAIIEHYKNTKII